MSSDFQSQRSSGHFLRWTTRVICPDNEEAPSYQMENKPHFADWRSPGRKHVFSPATLTPAESQRIT